MSPGHGKMLVAVMSPGRRGELGRGGWATVVSGQLALLLRLWTVDPKHENKGEGGNELHCPPHQALRTASPNRKAQGRWPCH